MVKQVAGKKTGGRRYRDRIKKQFPLPKETLWTPRAGKIAGEGSASSYKSAEIPEDAAKAIAAHFGTAEGRRINVLDSMAGEGKYGIPIAQYLQMQGFKPSVAFVDLTGDMLSKIPPTDFPSGAAQKDVRWRAVQSKGFDVVVVRYGLERLGKKGLLAFLRTAYKALRPGGILVHTSMLSDEGNRAFMEKYKLLKGDPEIKTPTPAYIPSHGEHKDLLEAAGFRRPAGQDFHLANERTEDGFYRSKVTARGWWLNHQFGKLPERTGNEADEEYIKRAAEANPASEKARLDIVKFFWQDSDRTSVRHIRLKFKGPDGKEVEWHPDEKTRRKMWEAGKIEDVEMNWPVATYVAVKPYKGGENKAGEPRFRESHASRAREL